MTHRNIKLLSLLCCIPFLFSCEDDEAIDMDDVYVPNGYALSAGTSTIFTTSTFAFESTIPVSPEVINYMMTSAPVAITMEVD